MNSIKTSSRGTDIDFLHADASKKAQFLKNILDDDIKSGFFMVFCESQFCTENIRFVVATIKYARLYEGEGLSWTPWETDLGKNLNGDKRIYNEMTPEKCQELERDMKYIHDRFLQPSGLYEICISPTILANTVRRMKEFRMYGPEVFKEARIDPMNTLIKDILPRFVVSPQYEEMKFYVQALIELPPASSLVVSPPNSSLSTAMSVKNKASVVDVALAELKTPADVETYCRQDMELYFVDALLYQHLLKYLTRIVASENLLCIRAINIFPQLFEENADSRAKAAIANSVAVSNVKLSTRVKGDTKKKKKGEISEAVKNQAWLIYMYFLAPGSCYEVGISSSISRSVALNMAKPVHDMFELAKVAAMGALRHHFGGFLESREFKELVVKAIERMETSKIASKKNKKGKGHALQLPQISMHGWFSSN